MASEKLGFSECVSIALCAGYSFNVLNAGRDEHGGTVAFLEEEFDSTAPAGMVGWTPLFGYVGSLAMYAYAFGSFATGLLPLPETLAGVPLRSVIAAAVVASFVGLNLMGPRSTGMAENVMVAVKVPILAAFGVAGLYHGAQQGAIELGFARMASAGPIMAVVAIPAAVVLDVSMCSWRSPR